MVNQKLSRISTDRYSLLPFEHMIKSRLTNHVLDSKVFPNKQQQEFQGYLGCINASFNLYETIYHNIERLSNVFVGFFDSRKAFDTVWRKGLMIKLHELGVTGRIWRLIKVTDHQFNQ